ncbi:MAG: gamma-glutamylcyclotransferase [Thermoleophilia bacterium]
MDDYVESVIYGTTLRGLPNHHRIAGCELLRSGHTAASYRMVTPDGSYPLLIEDGTAGAAFPCEIYRIPRATWDAKVAAEPPGLVVGEIALDDRSTVIGMLADPTWLATLDGVTDITAHGGWAAYAAARD